MARAVALAAAAAGGAEAQAWRRCRDDMIAQARNESVFAPAPVVFANGSTKAPPTLRLSGGCGRRPPAGMPTPGVLTQRDVTVADPGFSGGRVSRRYRVYLPSDYSSKTAAPILFRLHGFCGSETQQNNYHSIGAQHGAITVYARGQGDGSCNSWNNNNAGSEGDASCTNQARAECFESCNRLSQCSKCNCYTCADDSAFLRAMLDEIGKETCLDLGRVYVSGYSNGGGSAYHLPTDMPDVFAATLSVNGQPFEGVFRPTGSVRNTALLHVGSRSDNIMPVDGSPSTCGFVYVSQRAATRAWADAHNCGNGEERYTTPYDGSSGLECHAYTGCDGQSGRVVRCLINGGHSFPSLAYELTWWYLLQHSR